MDNDIKTIVANNLVALRKSKNMTQADVANTLNYSNKSVSKWEHADSLPDIAILCALADMYGVTLDYLTHADATEQLKYLNPNTDKGKRIMVSVLSIAVVYLVATIIYIYTLWNGYNFWQAFVWGVPASCIIMMFSRKYWGFQPLSGTLLKSILCWSLLASIYLQFMNYTLWLIFILGIPLEIIIVLSEKLKFPRRRNK